METLDFREFLEESFALHKYARNLRGRKIIEGGASHWVGRAFTWDETPEGYDFWLALHLLWIDLVAQCGREEGRITFGVPIKDKLGMALLAVDEEETDENAEL